MGVVGASGRKRSMKEGEGCVNTQTGSVSVAASQSNNVRTGTRQGMSSTTTDASLGEVDATTDARVGEISPRTDASMGASTNASQGQSNVKTTMDIATL